MGMLFTNAFLSSSATWGPSGLLGLDSLNLLLDPQPAFHCNIRLLKEGSEKLVFGTDVLIHLRIQDYDAADSPRLFRVSTPVSVFVPSA